MATYLRQLYYLLYKNVLFKLRHKQQITIEVVAVLLLSAFLAFIWKVHPTYDAIRSSEQIIYNSGEIPGGKRQHLAYVTNVNASEFYFFSWFYSLTLLIWLGRWPNGCIWQIHRLEINNSFNGQVVFFLPHERFWKQHIWLDSSKHLPY